MSPAAGLGAGWGELRYRLLLPLAARSRGLGAAYAALVGRVEYASDAARRTVAVARIGQALGTSRRRARRIFLASLESEAREEADTTYFMQHADSLLDQFGSAPVSALPGRAILATLHFGSPVLCFLYLRRGLGLDVSIVARPLDDSNPMASAKARYARAKVAWAERFSGRPFLSTDAASVARARDHLLADGSLYTPVDVPGDVATRSAPIHLFGGSVRVASGIDTLARLTRTPIQPIVAVGRPARRFDIWCGRPIGPDESPSPLASAMAELEKAIRRDPGEWWLWPYLAPDAPPLPGAARA